MEIDLTELILTGKISKDVAINGFTVTLTTPQINQTKDVVTNLDLLIQYISKIVDKSGKVEEFNSAESKKALAEKLNALQGVVVKKLTVAMEDLSKEQDDIIEGIAKK